MDAAAGADAGGGAFWIKENVVVELQGTTVWSNNIVNQSTCCLPEIKKNIPRNTSFTSEIVFRERVPGVLHAWIIKPVVWQAMEICLDPTLGERKPLCLENPSALKSPIFLVRLKQASYWPVPTMRVYMPVRVLV